MPTSSTPVSQDTIDSLQNENTDLSNQLQSSQTAYIPGATPTPEDISLDTKLTANKSALDRAQGAMIRQQWYGPTQADTSTDPSVAGNEGGWWENAIGSLQKPLNAIEGTAEYITGHGTGDYANTVNTALSEGHTFGTLLQKMNVPKIVAAPLGFAMDVGFDPVNWATVGSSALIPRLGLGAVKGFSKGGLEGALDAVKQGAISNIGAKVSNAASFIPSLRDSDMIQNLGKTAVAASEAYGKTTGTDVLQKLGKGVFGVTDLNQGKTLGNLVEQQMLKLPHGEDMVNMFKYSPGIDWVKQAELKDQVMKLAEGQGSFLERLPNAVDNNMTYSANGDRLASLFDPSNAPWTGSATTAPGSAISEQTKSVLSQIKSIADSGDFIARDTTGLASTGDPIENAKRILDEAGIDYKMKDLVSAYDNLSLNKTGVKWYDNATNAIKNFKLSDIDALDTHNPDSMLSGIENKKLASVVGKITDTKMAGDTMNAYQSFINLFKRSKVGASLSAYMNMTMGNLVMYHLSGGDVTNPDFYKTMKSTWDMLRGKNSDEFLVNNIFGDLGNWSDFMDSNRGTFSRTFGFDPRFIGVKATTDKIIQTGKDLGIMTAKNQDQVFQSLKEALSETSSLLHDSVDASNADRGVLGQVIDNSLKNRKNPLTSPIQMTESLMKEKNPVTSMLPTDWASNELTGNSTYAQNFLKTIAEKAKTGNPGYKILDAMFNKGMSWYGRIDQTYRLATAIHRVSNGMTEQELKLLSRFVPLSAEDDIMPATTIKNGQKMYHLTPEAATRASNETYVNYNAMPGAVRVLRTMPIFGAPFASFGYAMMQKTGKALLNNPAAFTKISSLLSEISGAQTPLEKQALTSKYNSYLNAPGMVKLPFFQDNPIYANLASMIPYYTMNMVTPSERKYGSTMSQDVMAIIDKSPFLKDPIGQTLFDYFIQPMMLQKGDIPQGQFGQPIYPSGATTLQKAGYATRDIIDAAVPGVASYAGLVTPEAAAKYIPSYKWRTLAEAKAGKDVLGVTTTEPAISRTIRALLSSAGIQLHPLDLTYLANSVKKSNTQ